MDAFTDRKVPPGLLAERSETLARRLATAATSPGTGMCMATLTDRRASALAAVVVLAAFSSCGHALPPAAPSGVRPSLLAAARDGQARFMITIPKAASVVPR